MSSVSLAPRSQLAVQPVFSLAPEDLTERVPTTRVTDSVFLERHEFNGVHHHALFAGRIADGDHLIFVEAEENLFDIREALRQGYFGDQLRIDRQGFSGFVSQNYVRLVRFTFSAGGTDSPARRL
jgi:hypothetical protein